MFLAKNLMVIFHSPQRGMKAHIRDATKQFRIFVNCGYANCVAVKCS